MCGIFGFSGKQNAEEILLQGLKRLEYRGYDSWGVATTKPENEISLRKEVGKIPAFDSTQKHTSITKTHNIGIAHTRWATHGGVTQINAHPHFSTDDSFALAQNGIVENYQEIREELSNAGYKFVSETDTEVIVRLIEREYESILKSQKENETNLFAAICSAFSKLEGRNTIIVLAKNSQEIIAIRNGSPLVVGKSAENEIFLGSDYLSFANRTNSILELDNNQGVIISSRNGNEIKMFSLNSKEHGEQINFLPVEFKTTEMIDSTVDKGEYADFMIKEINEQPDTILAATSYVEKDFSELTLAAKAAKKVYLVGCGTAAFAAQQIAYYMRKLAQVEAVELKGYELSSYREIFGEKDLMIAISQSGETADTIEAAELILAKGGKLASVVNMQGSTLSRLSHYKFFSRTGPEICVASTKAFTAQIAWGYLLAMGITGKFAEAKENLENASQAMQTLLNSENLHKQIESVVDLSLDKEHFFVLGRGLNFAIALEGALKVKEISYKHFEGFAAGELKHGVIALVQKSTPVFSIVSHDETKADMLSATAEVKTRGATTVGISPENNELFDYHVTVPNLGDLAPLVNVIPFQLIAYSLGKKLGNDVDKPRNLAKSVTVK